MTSSYGQLPVNNNLAINSDALRDSISQQNALLENYAQQALLVEKYKRKLMMLNRFERQALLQKLQENNSQFKHGNNFPTEEIQEDNLSLWKNDNRNTRQEVHSNRHHSSQHQSYPSQHQSYPSQHQSNLSQQRLNLSQHQPNQHQHSFSNDSTSPQNFDEAAALSEKFRKMSTEDTMQLRTLCVQESIRQTLAAANGDDIDPNATKNSELVNQAGLQNFNFVDMLADPRWSGLKHYSGNPNSRNEYHGRNNGMELLIFS